MSIVHGEGPVVAVALHAGHDVRDEVAALMAVDGAARLREEDPVTDVWVRVAPTHVTVARSRFEVDLNRPRARAVYGDAEDAWGIDVWRELPLPVDVARRSRAEHREFYAAMRSVLDARVEEYGGFVLLDLHSYNHRRGGPDAPAAGSAENPEVNVGTGTLSRRRWGSLVDGFMGDLAAGLGDGADVRENVKFRGGYLARWANHRYRTGCCLAIEFKKTYMDEWTGEPDPVACAGIAQALRGTIPFLERALDCSFDRPTDEAQPRL